jgi:hypothetical protein
MKNKLSIATALAVVLFAFSMVAAPAASAIGPVADAPVWHKGDKWAMGGAINPGVDFAQEINNLTSSLNQTSGLTVDRFQVQGSAEMWIVYEVTDVTATDYVVTGSLAGKVTIEVHVAVTADMPEPGNYTTAQLLNLPTAPRTLSADLVVELAVVSNAVAVFNKTTMAISSIDSRHEWSALVTLTAENVPQQKMYTEIDHVVISYYSIDFGLDFDLNLFTHSVFEPALNLVEFPLVVGKEWSVDSMATTNGTVSGHLDMRGLPSDVEAQMFSNETFIQLGITSFPIDFGKLTTTGTPSIDDGALEPFTTQIAGQMKVVSAETKAIPVHGEVTVFKIQVNNGSMYIYYSPDIGFFTSTEGMPQVNMPAGIELPITMPETDMQLPPATVADAEQGISGVAAYQAALSNEVNGGSSSGDNAFTDLFTKAPYMGIIALIAVVVVVAAAIVMVRRKK